MATFLFEDNSLPRSKNLALEDRKEDFSALKGRPSYTEFQFSIRMLIVVSINSDAVEFVHLLQLVQH